MGANEPIGVFDIGSNTVLLTCGRMAPKGRLEVLFEGHDVARLSEGLQDGGALQAKSKRRVLRIISEFKEQAGRHGITTFLAAGTAAFRRASDGAAFAEEIHRKTGIPVRILKGEEEAQLSFLSAQKDFGSQNVPLGMIDIGGGSTELVFGNQETWTSLPIGTVRLLEGCVSTDPISDEDWKQVRQSIARVLEEATLPNKDLPSQWVAVAATPTALAALLQKLAAYEPKAVHGCRIHRDELEETVETLRSTALNQRERMEGMLPKRAELLPIGGLILLELMRFLNLKEITASDHGLRYGLLYETLERRAPFTVPQS